MRIDLGRREREAVLEGLTAPLYTTEVEAQVAAGILFRLRYHVEIVEMEPHNDYVEGFVVRQVGLVTA